MEGQRACLGSGYAAAKYVVDPVVNYVPQLTSVQEDEGNASSETESTKKTDVIEDDIEIANKGNISGYALQFGCYSGKAAAESALPAIGISDLQIKEQDDLFKIVGEIYKTKEDAKKALEALPETVNAFVTPIYE